MFPYLLRSLDPCEGRARCTWDPNKVVQPQAFAENLVMDYKTDRLTNEQTNEFEVLGNLWLMDVSSLVHVGWLSLIMGQKVVVMGGHIPLMGGCHFQSRYFT